MNDDLIGRLLDEADNRGTIDYDRPETVERFMDDLRSFQEHDDWDGETIPHGNELTEDQQFDWIDFFGEYDLWDAVRDDWEDYEKAA